MVGKDLQRNIESALRFGKSIEKFVGIEKLLSETKANLSRDYAESSELTGTPHQVTVLEISVSVALTDGTIVYSTDEAHIGKPLPDSVQLDYGALLESDTPQLPSYIQYNSFYYTPLPILDRAGKWTATAIIAFDEQQVKNLLDRVRNNNITTITTILAGSMALLVILLNMAVTIDAEQQQLSKWRIALIMLVVIGAAQIVMSGILGSLAFLTYYLFGGLAATSVAILFLGLSDSTNASRAYALKLKISQEIGGGRAMSLYSSAGRIGQVAGPMLFGWLMAQGDILKGIIMFGGLYLGTTVLFLLLAKNDTQMVRTEP